MQKIKLFLKNQKTLASVILLLGIFGFAILVSQADDQKSAFETDNRVSEKNKDSDNDGLANWEEELLGTNPYQADTDGDGFLDGEEVLSLHDPLIKSPNDNLEYIALNREISETLREPKNLTEAIIENTATLSLNSSAPADADILANAIKQGSGDDFYSQALKKQILITLVYFLPPKINDSDLNIIQNNSAKAFSKYTSDLHAIFAKQPNVTEKSTVSDTQAVLFAIQQNNFRYSNSLASQWMDIYKQIKKIEVPSLLEDTHLTGLAAAYTLSKGYEALQEVIQDPAKVMIALQEIEKGESLVFDTFQQLVLINSI